jgi:hypothetical protein
MGELILSVHVSSARTRDGNMREAGGIELGPSDDPIPDDPRDRYDEALVQSFPASDPPAASGIVGPRLGRPFHSATQSDQQ